VILATLVACTGCGATINGLQSTVRVTSPTPGAEVYLNGGLVGAAPAEVKTGNAGAQGVTVRAPGHLTRDIDIGPKVRPLPIVLDVLWCATIIGVAAPISDLLLGTFVEVGPSQIDVALSATRGSVALREFSFAPGIAQNAADYAPGNIERLTEAYAP